MAKALTPEQYERIRAQLAADAGYACPDCLPVLSLKATPGRWRLIVDHTVGCETFADRVLRAELADPERDDQLMREVGMDKPPTAEQVAQWQWWADMTDAEFEEGMTT